MQYKDCKSILYDLTCHQKAGDIRDISHFEGIMSRFGFKCEYVRLPACQSLICTIQGNKKFTQNIAVVSHVDVVSGSPEIMQYSEKGEKIFVRGAVDMKGCIASLLFAIQNNSFDSNIIVLLLGDEETNSTSAKYISQKIRSSNLNIKFILGIEPSAHRIVGDNIKINRLSSVVFNAVVKGNSAHVGYSDKTTANIMVKKLNTLMESGFYKCNIVDINAEYIADNVTPSNTSATISIRSKLETQKIVEVIDKVFKNDNWEVLTSRDGYRSTIIQEHLSIIKDDIRTICGIDHVSNDSGGGVSDMLFFHDIAPCIEIGLPIATAHQEIEHTTERDMNTLSKVYSSVLNRFDSW